MGHGTFTLYAVSILFTELVPIPCDSNIERDTYCMQDINFLENKFTYIKLSVKLITQHASKKLR